MRTLFQDSKWSLPILILLVLAPIMSLLDMTITRFFYTIGNDPVEHFVSHPFFDFLFARGPLPAQITVAIAVVVLPLSYIFKSLRRWRETAITLILTLAIGAGLVTHLALKDHWGRPRPKQVKEFGGSQEFRPFYQPNFLHQPTPSRSFPCGHCTMGFFFFAVAIAGKRMQNKKMVFFGFALAWTLGILLSVARIAQGGHFLSDTLFSAAIMWYAALIMDWLVYADENAYSLAKARV
ncbi:Uncharacterized protein PHSC3_000018 [Chlamydiales bacterium STE3]|nr:Uncharacterized protein PHSC3_000018 [Chlamydiales bacterium STE3]